MDFKPFGSNLDISSPFVFFGISSIPLLKGLSKPTAPALALGIALSLSTAPAVQAYTPVVSFTYDGKSYTAYNNTSPITWSEARAYALSVGGDLVSLDTAAENGAVFAQITNYNNLWNSVPYSQLAGPYIGLFQPNASDTLTGWQWVDGSLLTNASWYTGQPDNAYGVENVAAYFNQVANGLTFTIAPLIRFRVQTTTRRLMIICPNHSSLNLIQFPLPHLSLVAWPPLAGLAAFADVLIKSIFDFLVTNIFKGPPTWFWLSGP
jgi:hypothetical protein